MPPKTEMNKEFEWPFGRKNYVLFGAGMLVITLGYITLAQTAPDPIPGDMSWPQICLTLSPALLVLGYCVLIPLSIIVDSGKGGNSKGEPTDAAPRV